MSFLKRVQAAALPKEIEGIKIVEHPITFFGKHRHGEVGVHVLDPSEQELHNAVDTAIRDGFPAIYVYNQKPKAHLYLVKADAPNVIAEKAAKGFFEFMEAWLDKPLSPLEFTEAMKALWEKDRVNNPDKMLKTYTAAEFPKVVNFLQKVLKEGAK